MKLSTVFASSGINCLRLSLDHSYIRVPLIKDKKGGGVRVKRILMYDKGIETGDESLYGSEYIYKTKDNISSGVATNEPSDAREENALINYMEKRAPQRLIQKIISGIDKENFEGPIGESLLPPASIGYSRVIVKNIHSGKTSTGFTVHEYNTCRYYPLSRGTDYTSLDEHAHDYLPIPAIWINILVDNRWVSQGYRFILNEMHGKPSRIATYGGNYVAGQSEDSYFKSFEQIFEYFQPGETIPVMKENGQISSDYVGKEVEIAMEMKSVDDIMTDAKVQIDFDLGLALFIPLPQFSLFPYFGRQERRFRSHTTSKVIRYPAIQKSVTTYQDGIYHSSENKVFSCATGKPIVVVNTDGYDKLDLQQSTPVHHGAYTSYTIPAHYAFKQMGQKANNERFVKTGLSASLSSPSSGKYQFDVADLATLLNNGSLTDGDLIVVNRSGDKYLFFIEEFSGTTIKVQSLSFIPPSLVTVSDFEVISSGYSNQLNASVGSVTTYGTDYSTNPVPPSAFSVSGVNKQQVNFANVISASAVAYSDNWTSSLVNSEYNLSSNLNDYETGRRGKWRSKSSYTYKSEITDAVDGTHRNYTGGIFTSFTGFNYSNLAANDGEKWLKVNSTVTYSPNGNALEDQNILQISSARA
jgi:hypothetical protein